MATQQHPPSTTPPSNTERHLMSKFPSDSARDEEFTVSAATKIFCAFQIGWQATVALAQAAKPALLR